MEPENDAHEASWEAWAATELGKELSSRFGRRWYHPVYIVLRSTRAHEVSDAAGWCIIVVWQGFLLLIFVALTLLFVGFLRLFL